MAAAKGNKYAKGNDGGRPLKIPTRAEFEQRIEAYFAKCDADKEPYTVTGLALGLELSGRQALAEYGAKEEFGDLIKKAKSKVEARYERNLSAGGCTGSIFALKNMGWRDQQDLNHSGAVEVTQITRKIVDPRGA